MPDTLLNSRTSLGNKVLAKPQQKSRGTITRLCSVTASDILKRLIYSRAE